MRPQVGDMVVHHLNTAAANKSGGAVSLAQHDDGGKNKDGEKRPRAFLRGRG